MCVGLCMSLTNGAESCRRAAHWENENVAKKNKNLQWFLYSSAPTSIIPALTRGGGSAKEVCGRGVWNVTCQPRDINGWQGVYPLQPGDVPPQLASIFVSIPLGESFPVRS